jgi:hypothetical protein
MADDAVEDQPLAEDAERADDVPAAEAVGAGAEAPIDFAQPLLPLRRQRSTLTCCAHVTARACETWQSALSQRLRWTALQQSKVKIKGKCCIGTPFYATLTTQLRLQVVASRKGTRSRTKKLGLKLSTTI